MLAMALVIATVTLSRARARRSLARRVRFAMLPTETFDPSPEEINRFAGMLLRARRSVRGARSRRSDAVRLRLVSLPGGRMLQLLEGPRRAESVLRLGGFSEVDLRPPETMDLAALAAVGLTSPPDDDGDDGTERVHRPVRPRHEQPEDDDAADAELTGWE